ncbi:MAG: NAD(P)/FAD-dependent oxidoreductase [Clostridium sp.]
MKQFDLVIIGGGIAGISAAAGALEKGIENILLIEREESLGGILNQCIHVGFGGGFLEEEVTGPEFVNYFEEKIKCEKVKIMTDTEVLDISNNKVITCVNPKEGVFEVVSKSIILATGCREKFIGSINIPTHKYTGIFTVGSAHKIVNLEGYLPGKEVVIKGNSPWSLIVARRLCVEGAKVKGIIINTEKNSFISEGDFDIIKGFDIPIFNGYKITEINGSGRIAEVKAMNVKTKEELTLNCDSLLLSVAYLSESKLPKEAGVLVNENMTPIVKDYATNIPGIFACGALIYGNEVVRLKNINGFKAGIKAGEYIKEYF